MKKKALAEVNDLLHFALETGKPINPALYRLRTARDAGEITLERFEDFLERNGLVEEYYEWALKWVEKLVNRYAPDVNSLDGIFYSLSGLVSERIISFNELETYVRHRGLYDEWKDWAREDVERRFRDGAK